MHKIQRIMHQNNSNGPEYITVRNYVTYQCLKLKNPVNHSLFVKLLLYGWLKKEDGAIFAWQKITRKFMKTLVFPLHQKGNTEPLHFLTTLINYSTGN